MLNGKTDSWTDKNVLPYKMNHFPEPHTHSKKKEVQLNLSHYVPKSDLKNASIRFC